jgi:hypothetical protein
MAGHAVMDALRRFLPRFLASRPGLSLQQWRAVNAIRRCRTPAMGGHVYACRECRQTHFAWHSCNHKACPQCGRDATRAWVGRQLDKLAGCPYFMVTFTLPQELRGLFFGEPAKEAFTLFFAAASKALADKLASQKGLKISTSGFSAVLHTWNQQLLFHPHIHCIVPGAGLRAHGSMARVKSPDYLLHLPALQAAFKQAFHAELERRQWEVDPAVWKKNWGVHIQPCGTGASAVKYLGAYVARTAIGDSRILHINEDSVTFRWKDRADAGRVKALTLGGVEFVRRYLRHVLPPKMHSVRHYGFCHPAAKKNRERVRFLTGMPLVLEDAGAQTEPEEPPELTTRPCPRCGAPMGLVATSRCHFDWSHCPGPPPDSS